MTERADTAVDIAILGGGPVGLALACALAGAQNKTPWRIALIERTPHDPNRPADPRALAIAYGSRQLLERLGAWDAIAEAGAATAIREVHVSQRGGFGRTLIRADDEGLPALGYVTPYGALVRALTAALEHTHGIGAGADTVRRFDGYAVEQIGHADAGAGSGPLRLKLVQHEQRGTQSAAAPQYLDTRLVVHAEGTPVGAANGVPDEALRGQPTLFTRAYHQHAIVAQVRPAQPHGGRAWERFTPDGPIALLPLGEACALVMTAPSAQTESLLLLDDSAFLAALCERFGRRLDFISAGPRAAFPLTLSLRTSPVAARRVWIGNGAQTLHPVSGQGFNLGLRDARALADTLAAHAARAHGDPGHAETLAAYARSRRLDRLACAAFTDGAVRAFSNDLPPLRALRGLGLLALDMASPLRHVLARRMIWGARAWP